MGQLGILGATIKGQSGMSALTMYRFILVYILVYSCILLYTLVYSCILLCTLVYSCIFWYTLFYVTGYGCAGVSSVAYGLIAREVER